MNSSIVLASHQPNFIPYLGFFYKMYKSDIFVIDEDILFSKSNMENWNYILTREGKKKITIPVNAHQDTRIVDVTIDNPKKNVMRIKNILVNEYKKAAHYNEGVELIELIESFSNRDVLYMEEINLSIIEYIKKRFGIKTRILKSIDDLDISGRKDERLIQMCKKTGATTYYSGTGARAYHDEKNFFENGIELEYSDYTPLVYTQMQDGFVENLSVVDYIFNRGYVLPENW